ncbi:unnamed protein product [Schistocephalus solidus]|uniref:SH2 domain-containing protein n=1 Tax=Schistocephalus solidus TaxID=70667 RepID=A0A0X3PFK2_SCHSO|nr:unnamed protein product [Schistocephalus solidus]
MAFTMRDFKSLGPPVPSRRCSSGNASGNCDTDEDGCPPEPLLPYRNSTTPQNLSARLKKSETLPSEGWQTVQWLRRKPSGCSLRPPAVPSEVSTLVQKESRGCEREVSRRVQQPSPPSGPLEPPKPMARLACLKVEDPKLTAGLTYGSLPPPLPPKRTSSRPAEYHSLTEDSSPLRVVQRAAAHELDGRAMRDSRLRGSSSTTSNTPVNESDCSSDSSSSNDTDLSAALQKISLRLTQLQVEKSPVLGHYSALYRLDETAWRNQNFSSSSSSPATTPQTWTKASPGTPPYMPRLHTGNARPRRCAYMNLSG